MCIWPIVSVVHELKMTLPLKREIGHHNCGEIEIELNDLHLQLSGSSRTEANEQDSRTPANASSTATQNGPTSTAANSVPASSVASGVAGITDDLIQLEISQVERRAGSQSPATSTPNNTTATAMTSTSTAGRSSTSPQTTSNTSGTQRPTGLAVAGTAAVAAVGGAAAVGAATGGNSRVLTPTPPAAANPPQRTPTPQVE